MAMLCLRGTLPVAGDEMETSGRKNVTFGPDYLFRILAQIKRADPIFSHFLFFSPSPLQAINGIGIHHKFWSIYPLKTLKSNDLPKF